jgi:hypothetical protein
MVFRNTANSFSLISPPCREMIPGAQPRPPRGRGADDNTNKFVELAQHFGFRIEQVLTLNGATERAQQ